MSLEKHPAIYNMASRREKQIKEWKRSWKFSFVETSNPDWLDLHDTIDVTMTLFEQ